MKTRIVVARAVQTANSAAAAAADIRDARRPREIGATVRRRRRRSGRRGRAFSKGLLYRAPPAAETAVVTRRSRRPPTVARGGVFRKIRGTARRGILHVPPTAMDAEVTRHVYNYDARRIFFASPRVTSGVVCSKFVSVRI